MAIDPSIAEVSQHPVAATPRRLLLLSTDMGMVGGAEEQVIRIAYGFKARGWEVLIVNMLSAKPMPPGFEQQGIPLMHLRMLRGLPDPRGILRLARIIRDFRPDVVHSHMNHANLLARAVRVIRPFPVLVCTLHNLTMAGVKRDWTTVFEIAHRLTDSRAELTTAICHAAADYCVRRRAVPASKMRVVHNGIDTSPFRPDATARLRTREELKVGERFAWLSAGRLELQKAYPTLLRAFARLDARERILLICGVGTLENQLRELARELSIADSVRFLGYRTDIAELMRAADGFAMSSDMEGLPLVLLQAAAAGLPIVATDVGGNSEVVVEGANGFLVAPGDPDAFAGSMGRLEAMSAADRLSLGNAGQERARTLFEAEQVINSWEQIFTVLLGAGGARPRRRASVRVEPENIPSELSGEHLAQA